MPKPVTFPFLPRASLSAFDGRSELAAAIGQIVIRWNWIEVQIQHLFVTLYGNDFHEAAEALYEDRNGHTRMRSVEDVMEFVRPRVGLIALSDEDQVSLRQAFNLWFRARASRNAIVHGLWQAHPREPNKVILLDKPAYLRFYASEQQQRAVGILTRTPDLTSDTISERRSNALNDLQDSARLYGAEDFQEILSSLDGCLNDFIHLNGALDGEIAVDSLASRKSPSKSEHPEPVAQSVDAGNP